MGSIDNWRGQKYFGFIRNYEPHWFGQLEQKDKVFTGIFNQGKLSGKGREREGKSEYFVKISGEMEKNGE